MISFKKEYGKRWGCFLALVLPVAIPVVFMSCNSQTSTYDKIYRNNPAYSGSLSPSPPPVVDSQSKPTVSTIELERILKNYENMGLVERFDKQLRKIYVSRVIWDWMKLEDKEIFTKAMAVYCGSLCEDKIKLIHVIDNRSGKELAYADNVWGFSIKE